MNRDDARNVGGGSSNESIKAITKEAHENYSRCAGKIHFVVLARRHHVGA